ncbi:MAG TPA: Uma2 family endonuclease [Blastocatellia bacterium]|nr:Uma2 family endonuclease [Blastocatellia bacterium]
MDFATDPPPDIVLEVDIHHDSRDKYSIYAAFGVPRLWRFDCRALSIHLLQRDRYEEAKFSSFPSNAVREYTHPFPDALERPGELAALTASDQWLQSQHS